jgi:hypothetical protein
MLNDELSDLAIFSAIADARSFTRAAALGSRDECDLMAKLVWRVKLLTALQARETTTDVEVARIERDEQVAYPTSGSVSQGRSSSSPRSRRRSSRRG